MNKNETQADVEAALDDISGRLYSFANQLIEKKDAPVWDNIKRDLETIRAALQRKAVDFEELEALKTNNPYDPEKEPMHFYGYEKFLDGINTAITHLKGKGA